MTKRVAVITGGNRGIGFEVSRQLGRLGIRVILTSRNRERGRSAVARLADEGLDLEYYRLDVTDLDDIKNLCNYLREDIGRLDVLVNNAAVYIDKRHRLLDVNEETLLTTMATNAYGPLWLTQALVPLMRDHNYGRIVNVSSGIGELSSLGSSWPAYRLSKIFLNLQTRIIAKELKGSHILINAVCPGWVRTEMGGPGAPRSVEKGAETIVWLATLPDGGPQGGFFRDRKRIEW